MFLVDVVIKYTFNLRQTNQITLWHCYDVRRNFWTKATENTTYKLSEIW